MSEENHLVVKTVKIVVHSFVEALWWFAVLLAKKYGVHDWSCNSCAQVFQQCMPILENCSFDNNILVTAIPSLRLSIENSVFDLALRLQSVFIVIIITSCSELFHSSIVCKKGK